MGTSYTSMTLGGVNYKWQVEAAATTGSFYVKNLDRDPEKPYYMQWYADMTYWSGYHTLNEELMALSFYVKGDAAPTPDPDPTPDPEPTTSDYSIASSLSIGDRIIVVVKYEDKYYAVANDAKTVNNALNAVEVTVTDASLALPADADLAWEVCAGTATDAVTLKSSDGKYIKNTSSTSATLAADAGSDLTITCGDGTSVLLLTATANASTVRNLFLRMNNDVPQFRFYSTSNRTSQGYSAAITIWKAN